MRTPTGAPHRLLAIARRADRTDPQTRLAEVRVSRGVYQHELAQATGISIASIKRLEQGEVANPPLWWYVNCALALNVALEEILDPELASWRATPSAPRPPSDDWLTDRYERSVGGDTDSGGTKQR